MENDKSIKSKFINPDDEMCDDEIDDYYIFEYINTLLDDDIDIFSHSYVNTKKMFYFLQMGESVGGEEPGIDGDFAWQGEKYVYPASRYISFTMDHFNKLTKIGNYAKNNVNKLEKTIDFLLGKEKTNDYELQMISTDQYLC